MIEKQRCKNFNHGRMNVPIKYCPACGELLNAAKNAKCNASLHVSRQKERNSFCCDCGLKLNR